MAGARTPIARVRVHHANHYTTKTHITFLYYQTVNNIIDWIIIRLLSAVYCTLTSTCRPTQVRQEDHIKKDADFTASLEIHVLVKLTRLRYPLCCRIIVLRYPLF